MRCRNTRGQVRVAPPMRQAQKPRRQASLQHSSTGPSGVVKSSGGARLGHGSSQDHLFPGFGMRVSLHVLSSGFLSPLHRIPLWVGDLLLNYGGFLVLGQGIASGTRPCPRSWYGVQREPGHALPDFRNRPWSLPRQRRDGNGGPAPVALTRCGPLFPVQ